MKRFMMITVLVATVAVAWASDYKYLVLQQTDGTEIPLPAEGLKLTFSDGNLVASDGTTVSLASLSMMCFSEDATAIYSLSSDSPAGVIEVYTTSGMLMGHFNSTQAAQQSLQPGIYVMKNNGRTQKIAVR